MIDTEALEPDPTWRTSTPVVTSMIERPYGVGATSLLAVTVMLTAAPTAGFVVVAAMVTA